MFRRSGIDRIKKAGGSVAGESARNRFLQDDTITTCQTTEFRCGRGELLIRKSRNREDMRNPHGTETWGSRGRAR